MKNSSHRAVGASTALAVVFAGFLASASPAIAGNTPDVSTVSGLEISTASAAPVVTITSPAPGMVLLAGQVLTVEATISDDDPWRTFIDVSGPSGRVATLTNEDGWLSFSQDFSTVSYTPGLYTVTVSTRDVALNKDEASTATVQFSIGEDTTAPVVAITAPAPGLVVAPGTPVVVTATIDDVNPWRTNFAVNGATQFTDVTGMTSFTRTIDTVGLGLGTHSILVAARDGAGNRDANSEASVDFTIAEDTQPPTVTFTSPASDSAHAGIVTVTGTVTDDLSQVATLDLVVRAVDPVSGVCDGTSERFAVAFDADGSWSIDIDSTTFDDGTYCMVADEVDTASNRDPESALLNDVRFDNSVPSTVTLVAPASGAVVTVGSFDLRWDSVGPDTEYEVRWSTTPHVEGDGSLVGISSTLGSRTSVTWYSMTAMTPVTYHWQVRAINVLGSAGPWSETRVVTVAAPPTPPPAAPPASPPSSGTPAGQSVAPPPPSSGDSADSPTDSDSTAVIDDQLTTFGLDDSAETSTDDANDANSAADAAEGLPSWLWIFLTALSLLGISLVVWRIMPARRA